MKQARSSGGERYLDAVEVGGSIPPAPTIFSNINCIYLHQKVRHDAVFNNIYVITGSCTCLAAQHKIFFLKN